VLPSYLANFAAAATDVRQWVRRKEQGNGDYVQDILKVGSHEEFFPVALVLGVKYPMHHNFLSIRS